MELIGGFNIKGEMRMRSDYFTVYRKGDMLVLEFINNVVLPLRVYQYGPNGYNCWVQAFRLFSDEVAEDDIIVVRRRRMLSGSDIYVQLSVLGKSADLYSVNIEVCLSGKVQLFMNPGTKEEFTNIAYSDSSMRDWCRGHGVRIPEGCSYIDCTTICTGGCSLEVTPSLFLVGFPNHFKFPIIRTESGVSIVGNDIQLRFPTTCGLLVNIKCVTADFVVFHVVFVDNWAFVRANDIVYTRDYAKYAGRSMKSVDITKSMLLGVR